MAISISFGHKTQTLNLSELRQERAKHVLIHRGNKTNQPNRIIWTKREFHAKCKAIKVKPPIHFFSDRLTCLGYS